MHLQISNYRAIRAGQPIELELGREITFLLGRNNVGKTSVLRFFSELRALFQHPVDMRSPLEFPLEIGTAHWDSIAHRETPDQPMLIEAIDGRSRWQYQVRPAEKNHFTNKLLVKFTPVQYVSDNDAALRANQLLARALYFGPFRSTAHSGYGGEHEPFTGSPFITAWSEWSSGPSIEKRKAALRLQSEIKALFGFQEFKLYLNHDRNGLLVDYDEGTFKLTELGEGLSHFIIVLANALIRQPSFILIDEPENGLHPKLQATFVQTLARKASHGLLATSHSMALARSVADAVVYCTRPAGRGLTITAHQGLELSHVIDELREMSYSQHIEAGEQNLLLVEGRTDIKAFRELLKLYGIDQRFIFLALGGGAFTAGDPTKYEAELAELTALGTKSITIILDSERSQADEPLSKGHQRFAEVCQRLGFDLHFLERRSLENYFTSAAVQKHCGDTRTALGPYEKFQESPAWKKSDNWRLIAAMARGDLDATDLGKFVTAKLLPRAQL